MFDRNFISFRSNWASSIKGKTFSEVICQKPVHIIHIFDRHALCSFVQDFGQHTDRLKKPNVFAKRFVCATAHRRVCQQRLNISH